MDEHTSYTRLIKLAERWTRDELFESFVALTYATEFKTLERVFEEELNPSEEQDNNVLPFLVSFV